MKDSIGFTHQGLQCDGPDCSYVNANIPYELYSSYINKPCPECGEDLLTYDDFKRVEKLREFVELINNPTLENIYKVANDEELNKLFLLVLESLPEEGKGEKGTFNISFDLHNDIKVKNVVLK